jgi:hypothetical protein
MYGWSKRLTVLYARRSKEKVFPTLEFKDVVETSVDFILPFRGVFHIQASRLALTKLQSETSELCYCPQIEAMELLS